MILVDSGPLMAAAISGDRDHRRCIDMFASLHLNSKKLLVPQTVVAEVAYTAGTSRASGRATWTT
jgi:uncharacterized protein